MKKIFLILFFVLVLLSFYASEKDTTFTSNNYLNEKIHSIIFMDKDFNYDIKYFKTVKKPEVKKKTPVLKNKQKADAKVNSTKKKLTNKQKAAIAVNASGAGLLAGGVGLLVASFVYADYVEKNEIDYDKYAAGKNLSRGLFYGSTAGLGTGAVCITVSIPLFIERKNKNIKKENKSIMKNKKTKISKSKKTKKK